MKHRSKLPQVATSIFSVMSALANEHGAINLSQGFPNFKSDQKLIDFVNLAMNSGHNQYAPMAGNMELRRAISKKFELVYGSSYHPETEITVTAGATQAIYTIISAFIHPHDEVIIFKPAYDCYEPAVQINGGKTIAIQMHGANYAINWDEVASKISAKTKLIIINTPHNPSGTVLSENDMQKLQALTAGTDILVLSDEVYEHMVFDNLKHQSACLFPDLKARSFIVASFGKTFHNTGWKLGYCCAPKALMSEFQKVHQFNVFSVNSAMQKGLADYLKTPSHYLDLAHFYQEKRDYFLQLIKDSRFSGTPAAGTYFQVLDYTNISEESDVSFAKKITIKNGLAAIPMSVFNIGNKDHKVLRFCFAKTNETLKKAAAILNQL
ncbi:methionine aminotransferase [Bizionia sediminis]|uniref:Methionine aminotransferase n=1 Tax=Bizionia sediminis TaxID=1737064 RepID=A0ABW5KU54_9FLAO